MTTETSRAWTTCALACLAMGAAAVGCSGAGEPGGSAFSPRGAPALVSAAPSPVVARSHHTLGLRNGSAYIVGGNASVTPSVEVLDPASGALSAGPELLTNRRSHAMVTLGDGTFVVFGGIGSAGVLSSVERLAPGSSAWQAAAAMPAAVYGHSATVLSDGRVLVAGGVGYRNSAWLYDPLADAWTVTGSLALGRMMHGAARLPDGSVLVAGGSIATSSSTNTAEIYSPTTGTWSSAGTMATSRGNTSLAVVAAGLRAGNVVVAGTGTSVEQYSAANGFSALGPSIGAHDAGQALALADGSVLLYGDNFGNLSIEQLGPSASTWAVVDSMPSSRDSAPAVELSDGRVLVVGGRAFPAGGGSEFARADAFYWAASGSCVPTSCASAGATCGSIPDNCGGTLVCGTCGTGQSCSPSHACVAACVPSTCSSLSATCGTPPDGCGATLSCGSCGAGLSCSNYVCSAPSCTPTTCAALGLTCGTASDGCGGTLTCGPACSAGTVAASYDATLKAPLCASASSLCSAVTTGRAGLGPEANSPNTIGGTCLDGTSGVFHSDESIDAVRVRSSTGAALASGGSAQVEVDVWAYAGFSSDTLDVFVTTTPTSPVWTLVGSKVATKAGAQTLVVPLTLPVSSSSRYAVRAQFRYIGSATSCNSGSFNDRDDLVFAVGTGSTGTSTLSNGGFESALASWTASGAASTDSTAGLSHGGSSHLTLRPQSGSPASVSQSFTVPGGTTSLTLYARPETASTTTLTDNLRVIVTSPGVATFDSAVASNLTSPGTWSAISANISSFAGLPVTLTLRSESTVISSAEFFRVDDVALH